MGIDLTPGGAHWSYSSFHHFRRRLAEAEGFKLDEMEGFGNSYAPAATGHREWSDVTTTLEPLLNHSDCDGSMRPSECRKVLPRLTEIVESWPDGDYDKQEGRKLIDGMKDCLARNVRLKFR